MSRRPIGWRYEPYRHYLAAKGVSTTRRYGSMWDSLKQGIASGIESSTRKGEGEMEMHRLRKVDAVRSECLRAFQEKVAVGDIRPEKEGELVKELAPMIENYKKGQLTDAQFHEDMKSTTEYFLKTNASRLHVL